MFSVEDTVKLLVILVFLSALCYADGVFAQGRAGVTGKWREISRRSVQVELQATTGLSLLVRRDGQGRPILGGELRDDRGGLVSGVRLWLVLPGGRRVRLKTGKKGGYSVLGMGFPTKGRYTIFFPGEGHYSGSSRGRFLDLGRVDLELGVGVPPPLLSGQKQFEVKATLSYQGKALGGYPLTLYLRRPLVGKEDGGPSELPLMTFHTNAEGGLRFLWQGKKALLGPARLRLLVRYAGNRFFLSQERKFELVVQAPPADRAKIGWWNLFLGGVVVCFLGLLGTLVMLYVSRRRKDELLVRPRFRVPVLEDVGVGGMDLRIPHQLAPMDLVMAGRVLDAIEGTVVPGAVLSLVRRDGFLEDAKEEEIASLGSEELSELVVCDGEGRFFWDFAMEGRHLLHIEHPHYRPRVVTFGVPHHGQGRSLRISLLSYRTLVYEIYRTAVFELVPGKTFEPRIQTAREILRELPKEVSVRLLPLARSFEEAYYSPRWPDRKDYLEVIKIFNKTMNDED